MHCSAQVAGFDGLVKPEEAEEGEIDELVRNMNMHVMKASTGNGRHSLSHILPFNLLSGHNPDLH